MDKYLSPLIEKFFPEEYIREKYPLFVTFIQKFLEFLETQNNVGDLILNYEHFIDIDKLDENNTIDKLFLDKYANQYLSTFPVYKLEGLNLKTLIKNAKDLYNSKGSQLSYQLLFNILNKSGSFSFYYPSRDILITSDKINGIVSSTKYIHDNFKYAYYTYEIISDQYGYYELKDIILNVVHPAGIKVFFKKITYLENDDIIENLESDCDISILLDSESLYHRTNIYMYDNITFEDIDNVNGTYEISQYMISDIDDIFYNLENPNNNYCYIQQNVDIAIL